jgi:hypothetical protein
MMVSYRFFVSFYTGRTLFYRKKGSPGSSPKNCGIEAPEFLRGQRGTLFQKVPLKTIKKQKPLIYF